MDMVCVPCTISGSENWREQAADDARTAPYYHSQSEGRPMLRKSAAVLAVVLSFANVNATRADPGPDSRSDAHCATNVGDWEEPSGESRIKLWPL
jgi:hypothetical protein